MITVIRGLILKHQIGSAQFGFSQFLQPAVLDEHTGKLYFTGITAFVIDG